MSLGNIPAHLTISEFALASGVPRGRILRLVQGEKLPAEQYGSRGRRYIPMARIRDEYPNLWASIVERWDEFRDRLDSLGAS